MLEGWGERKPKDSGLAAVRVLALGLAALNTLPSAKCSSSPVLTWKAAGTSTLALGPNTTPEGLMKKKSAFPTCERSSPSMLEISPPVTLLMTFSMASGPVKVALSPVKTENF